MCKVCGFCQGTQLVTQKARRAWLDGNPDPEPPKAA